MDNDNLIVEISEDFAVRIVNLYKHLLKTYCETVMSKQLLRCGTSIGANIAEAQEAQSKKDFIAKLYISLKESRETRFWLNILLRSKYLQLNEYNSINNDLDSIRAVLTKIIKSSKTHLDN